MTFADVSEHVQLQAALMSLAENQLALLSSILPQVGICRKWKSYLLSLGSELEQVHEHLAEKR